MSAGDYFQAYKDYFWQWEEGGDVVAIPGSSTIAYKAFLVDALDKISGQGFPPFGALLLAVIATNAEGDKDLNTVYALMDKIIGEDNDVNREPLTSAISFLKELVYFKK